jgi:hypothetical protein
MKNQMIGSIKLGRINFKPDENFFNSTYASSEKRKAKKEIMESVSPDYLGIKKPRWNQSVSLKNDFFDFNHHVLTFMSSFLLNLLEEL